MSAAVSLLNTKVLVLNRSYLPIHITSVKRAFSLLYQGVAHAVDEQYKTFDFQSWSDLALSEPCLLPNLPISVLKRKPGGGRPITLS